MTRDSRPGDTDGAGQAVWSPLFQPEALARLAEDMRIIGTPPRIAMIARLAAGSAELVDLAALPYVRDISRQSVHEGMQSLIQHGWVKRERIAERDPWVYALANADIGRGLTKLAMALIDTDLELRYQGAFLREVMPESVAETRRNPRYCRSCGRLTGWFHRHRTIPGARAVR